MEVGWEIYDRYIVEQDTLVASDSLLYFSQNLPFLSLGTMHLLAMACFYTTAN